MSKYPKVSKCKARNCPHLKTVPGTKASCCDIGRPGGKPIDFQQIVVCPLDHPVY